MYVKYFKFNGKPFGINPDPKFFFNGHTHKRALSCLGYGLSQGQGFVVITGDTGTGKTMLMSALLHMLAQTNIITARIINTQLQSDEMLRYVAAELGLPFEDQSKVTLLKSIESFLEDCRAKGKRIVVIVDEAQNLSRSAVEELRMLMNLVTGNEPLLEFVLLGQTSLQEQLYTEAYESLRQRIVTSYHLEQLGEEETKAYIIQRLRTVGWVGDPDLSPGAFIAIYEQTHGIPAKINMLCGKILQAACLNESHEISEEDVLKIIREMNNSFSDNDFSGTLVEGVIDALVEKRQKKLEITKPVISEIEPKIHEDEFENTIESVENTFEDTMESQVRISDEVEDEIDTRGGNFEDQLDDNNLPLVSEQITIDQALIEARSIQTDEEIDGEINEWLQQQKQRIKSSRKKQLESDKKITGSSIKKKSTFENTNSLSGKLSLDDFESTLEDPPF